MFQIQTLVFAGPWQGVFLSVLWFSVSGPSNKNSPPSIPKTMVVKPRAACAPRLLSHAGRLSVFWNLHLKSRLDIEGGSHFLFDWKLSQQTKQT